MEKIIFLLPPSEGKKFKNKYSLESLIFKFEKPLKISVNVNEKDLRCKGKRFLEGVELNKNIENYETIEAINRYSGVMYNAIDYNNMQNSGKKYFEDNFLILSGMYGIVKPLDKIGNYKLPIETNGLLDFWGSQILEKINTMEYDFVVNLLPISYTKLIFGKNKKLKKEFEKIRKFKIININFLKENLDKVSHGVKKIKGKWIKNICEKNIINYKKFGGEIIENGNIIDINIIKK